MKYILTISIFLVCIKNIAAQDNTEIPNGYELIWADEFEEGAKPNPEFWSYENGFVRQLKIYNISRKVEIGKKTESLQNILQQV